VLEARLAGLVHDSVEDPVERTRQERFILVRLTAGGLALAALPGYLALRGAPTAAECAAALALVAQLGAALVLVRTGLMAVAHAVSSAALAAFIAGTVVSGGSPLAALWLLAVPIEALMSGSRRAIVAAAGLAALAALSGSVLERLALAPTTPWPGLALAVLAVLCAAHAVAQAVQGARFDRDSAAAAARLRHDRPVLQVIDDLVTWHDRNGHVLQASAAATKLLGVAPATLHGRGMFGRVHVADRPAFLKAISDAATGHQAVAVQFRLHAAASEDEPNRRGIRAPTIVWVEMRAHRVERDPGDDPASYAVVAVTRDVSEHRRHAEELELARTEAEKADALKGRFLATVSHELRTPLNAIIGFSEILAMDVEPKLDAERSKEYARIIRGSGQHLLEVVNTLLDLSKIETGNFDFVPEAFDLAPLVHGCCDLIALRAEQEGVDLTRDIAADLPEFVSDRRACRQMLINLLSNAVKFTPRGGGIAVAVRREQDSIGIVVADSGVGIREEDLPRLGEPFFQASTTYDRAHEGTGLGLSVVRGLVALHRGTMNIESAPGRGTIVTLTLPIDCRWAPSPTAESERVRVLARPLERLPILKTA
jgi:cell cycle sensor histidine kinase DivJ